MTRLKAANVAARIEALALAVLAPVRETLVPIKGLRVVSAVVSIVVLALAALAPLVAAVPALAVQVVVTIASPTRVVMLGRPARAIRAPARVRKHVLIRGPTIVPRRAPIRGPSPGRRSRPSLASDVRPSRPRATGAAAADNRRASRPAIGVPVPVVTAEVPPIGGVAVHRRAAQPSAIAAVVPRGVIRLPVADAASRRVAARRPAAVKRGGVAALVVVKHGVAALVVVAHSACSAASIGAVRPSAVAVRRPSNGLAPGATVRQAVTGANHRHRSATIDAVRRPRSATIGVVLRRRSAMPAR
jgi:hypothetical protein